MQLPTFFGKLKIVATGTILAILIIIIGMVYSYFKFDQSTINAGVVIEGRYFQILKKFKDNKVDFNNFASMVNATFDNLQDNRNYVEPVGNGRENPFAP